MIWAALDKGTENLRAQVLLLNLEHHLWAWETLSKDKENVFILPWMILRLGVSVFCIVYAMLCRNYTHGTPSPSQELLE